MTTCVSSVGPDQWDANGDTLADCANSVVITISQYDQFMAESVQPTLEGIFAVPVAPDLTSAWMTGFGLPLTLYLVSWAYGRVLSFMNENEHH
jgi:hypothetical protein